MNCYFRDFGQIWKNTYSWVCFGIFTIFMEHMGNIFHPLSFSFVLLVERQFYAITLCMRYVKLSKCALCMLYDSYVDELSYYYISLKGVVICTFWIDGMNRVNYGSKDICEKRFAKSFWSGKSNDGGIYVDLLWL